MPSEHCVNSGSDIAGINYLLSPFMHWVAVTMRATSLDDYAVPTFLAYVHLKIPGLLWALGCWPCALGTSRAFWTSRAFKPHSGML